MEFSVSGIFHRWNYPGGILLTTVLCISRDEKCENCVVFLRGLMFPFPDWTKVQQSRWRIAVLGTCGILAAQLRHPSPLKPFEHHMSSTVQSSLWGASIGTPLYSFFFIKNPRTVVEFFMSSLISRVHTRDILFRNLVKSN